METFAKFLENKKETHCASCELKFDNLKPCLVCKKRMCVKCYKTGHEHNIELGIPTTEDDLYQLNQNNNALKEPPLDRQHESVSQAAALTTHAASCKSKRCPKPRCPQMKKVIGHVYKCQRINDSGRICPICATFISIYCAHAKNCKLTHPKMSDELLQQLMEVLRLCYSGFQEDAMEILKSSVDLRGAYYKLRKQETGAEVPILQEMQPDDLDLELLQQLYDTARSGQSTAVIGPCGVASCAELKWKMQAKME